MKKTVKFLVVLLAVVTVASAMSVFAFNDFKAAVDEYGKYGYYAYFDFENYGNPTDHLVYMRSDATNANGLACDPFGFMMDSQGWPKGEGSIVTDENGNQYLHYVQSGDGGNGVIGVFAMQDTSGKNAILADSAELSFRFRMSSEQPSTATGEMDLIKIRRGSYSGEMPHLTADAYGNLYARIDGKSTKVYTNGNGSTVGGDGKFMDISFRWYDATNTYSVYVNGNPVAEGIPLAKEYRSSSYITKTYNNDFEVDTIAVKGGSSNANNSGNDRAIEFIRRDSNTHFAFDIDDIKISRLETAQKGAYYYENTFSSDFNGVTNRIATNNIYRFASGVNSSTLYGSVENGNGVAYIGNGQYIGFNDDYYQLFTKGSYVIEFSVKATAKQTSGMQPLAAVEYIENCDPISMLWVDSDGKIYLVKDDYDTLVPGFLLDGKEWLDITLVAIKDETNANKFGTFKSGQNKSSSNQQYKYGCYINGKFVGISYAQDVYEWAISNGSGKAANGYSFTITHVDGAFSQSECTAVDEKTTSGHVIYKSSDGLKYYDVEASANKYSTMTLTSATNNDTLKLFAGGTFEGYVDNIRIYEGTSPQSVYEAVNSPNGGVIFNTEFAHFTAPNSSKHNYLESRCYTKASGADVLGLFIASGIRVSDGDIDYKSDEHGDYASFTLNDWFDYYVPIADEINGTRAIEYSFETTVKNISMTAGTEGKDATLYFFSSRFENNSGSNSSSSLITVKPDLTLWGGNYKFKLCEENGNQIVLDNNSWNTLRADVSISKTGADKATVTVSYFYNGKICYLEDKSPAKDMTMAHLVSVYEIYYGTTNYRLRYSQKNNNDKITLDIKSINISANAKPVYNTVTSTEADINDNVTVIELDISKYKASDFVRVYDLLSLIKTSDGVDYKLPLLTADPLTGKVYIGISGYDYELCDLSGKAYTMGDTPMSIAIVYDDLNNRVRYYVNETHAYINLSGKLTAAVELGTDNYSFTQLGSVSKSGYILFGGRGNTGEGAVDISTYNLKTYNVKDGDTAEIIGFQENEITNGIRIITGLDTLYYSNIGFELETFVDGVSQGKRDIFSNSVFSKVNANDRDLTAESLGYEYLGAMAITNLPNQIADNTYIELRSYAEVGSFRHYDESINIIITKDGYYFEKDGVVYQNSFDGLTELPSEWKIKLADGATGSVSMSSDGGIFISNREDKYYNVYLDKYVGPDYVIQADITVKALPTNSSADSQLGINFGYTIQTPVKYGRIYIDKNGNSKFFALFTGGKGYDYTVEASTFSVGKPSVGKTYTLTLICTEGKYAKYFVDGKFIGSGTFKDGQGYDQNGMISFFSKGYDILIDNVVIRTPDSVTVNGSTIDIFKIGENKNTSPRIRVATFNLGDFSTATDTAGYTTAQGNGTDITKAEYIAAFKKADADIWGVQEDSQYFDYAKGLSAKDAVYSAVHPYHAGIFTHALNGKAFVSDYTLYDVQRVYYTKIATSYSETPLGYSHPWFLIGKTEIDGKEIALISLHFDWDCKEKRSQQIKEVIAYAAKQEYCIIMGDFNPQNYVGGNRVTDPDDPDNVNNGHNNIYQVDWKKFTDAGFVTANGGRFGVFQTMVQDGKLYGTYPWDNVFVSPNITIINAEVIVEPWMNDHAIFVADLELNDSAPVCIHDLVYHEAKAPTHNDIGWNEYVTCSKCGYTTYEELPPDKTLPEDEYDVTVKDEEVDEREYIFNYTFDNVSSMHAETPSGFALMTDSARPYELVEGEKGYIKNSTDDGYVFINDQNKVLVGKSFIFEAELTFTAMPVERDENKGKGSYPLSILTWIRQSETGASYDSAFRLDGDGYIYTTSTTEHIGTKLEVGQKYVIGVYYTAEGQIKILINGKQIAEKSFTPYSTLTSSILRLMDSSRAHFGVQIHKVCAYYSDMSQFLSDAERSLFEVTNDLSSGVYFNGYTDKDALSYAVGEDIKLEVYLIANNEVVSVPYFYYTVEGEDGKEMTSGYADGSKGHFTVTTKMSKPGHAFVTVYMCDADKNKITENIVFRGGAMAGSEQILPGVSAPADFESYWSEVVNECYMGDINLVRFEEVSTDSYSYDTSKYKAYLFEVGYGNGEIATGYLTYPIGKDNLKLRILFRGYGNTRTADPKFADGYVTVEMAPHGFRIDDPNPQYPDLNYGFDPVENSTPDTVYFHGMITRNILGSRFLKAFAGGEEFGKIYLNGEKIEPLGVWEKGDYYMASGGSQGGFQAISLGALDKDVTNIGMYLPWMCDIGGQTIGRFPGNLKPAYTNALMYYDCCSFATLVDSDVTVEITAGFGDRTCPPSGIMAVYNTLDCFKSITVSQNVDHAYTPPSYVSYRLRNH